MTFKKGDNSQSLGLTTSKRSSSPWPTPTQPKPVRRRERIHWKAPSLIVFAFIVGITAAIGHHVFYSSMNGRIVESELQQQVVTTTGTALAFLVKVLLAVSSGTAFTQCLWFSMRSQAANIQQLDSMFGVLSNPLEFLNLRFWLGHPVLTITAATTWLVPLSAIFSSSTVSVAPKMHDSLELVKIPQRDNNDGNSVSWVTLKDGSNVYGGAGLTTSYVSTLNIENGRMLSVPVGSGAQNLSYNLDFHGPALQCTEADNSTSSFVMSAVNDYNNKSHGGFLYWAGWVPPPDFGQSPINGSFFANLGLGQNLSADFPGLYFPSNGFAKVYQTLFLPDSANGTFTYTGSYSVIECSLYNASYTSHFELHSNQIQTISTNRTLLDGLLAVQVLPPEITSDQAIEYFNDLTLMNMFGYNAVGSTIINTKFGNPNTLSNIATAPTLGAVISATPIKGKFMDFQQFSFLLEELFQNFTLSWRYGSIPSAGGAPELAFTSSPQTTATLHRSRNTFVYNQRPLVVAYGLAALFSFVSLVCGLAAIYANGLSYTNNFSTILRMTRDHAFDEIVDDEQERNGADPLPEHIGDAKVAYFDGMHGSATFEIDRRSATGIIVLGHV